jgi:hypothetical protein
MAKFRIVAVDARGVEQTVSMEAESEEEALAAVKAKGLFTTRLDTIAQPEKGPPPLPGQRRPDTQIAATRGRAYTYKMVQIPPSITVKDGVPVGHQAAAYLEGVVNGMAEQGWEFYRIDSIGVRVTPGCLMALIGVPATNLQYYVVTFRRSTG